MVVIPQSPMEKFSLVKNNFHHLANGSSQKLLRSPENYYVVFYCRVILFFVS